MPRIELFPFRYRDPRTGKWIRAQYVATPADIVARHAEWEITGPAEIRNVDPNARAFSPFKAMMDAELRTYSERPPELQPAIDATEAFLLAVFLRQYVAYCARRGRFAAMGLRRSRPRGYRLSVPAWDALRTARTSPDGRLRCNERSFLEAGVTCVATPPSFGSALVDHGMHTDVDVDTTPFRAAIWKLRSGLSVRLTTRADANLSDDDLIALAESLLTKRDVPEWSTLGDLIIVTDWQDDLDA